MHPRGLGHWIVTPHGSAWMTAIVAFAALLEGLTDEGGLVQRIVPVDARDLGILPGNAGARHNIRLPPFLAARTLGCRSN